MSDFWKELWVETSNELAELRDALQKDGRHDAALGDLKRQIDRMTNTLTKCNNDKLEWLAERKQLISRVKELEEADHKTFSFVQQCEVEARDATRRAQNAEAELERQRELRRKRDERNRDRRKERDQTKRIDPYVKLAKLRILAEEGSTEAERENARLRASELRARLMESAA